MSEEEKNDIDVLCIGVAVMDVFGKSIVGIQDWGRLSTFDRIEYHVGTCAVNAGIDLTG